MLNSSIDIPNFLIGPQNSPVGAYMQLYVPLHDHRPRQSQYHCLSR